MKQPRRYSNERIVSQMQENRAVDPEALLIAEFLSAYKELRKSCPDGDLHIKLFVNKRGL